MSKQATNESGYAPIDQRILILPDEVSDKTGGGRILVPDTTRERQQQVQTKATIIATGDSAGREWSDREREIIQTPGTRVLVGKYVGAPVEKGWTNDGKEYRLINDADIMGYETM